MRVKHDKVLDNLREKDWPYITERWDIEWDILDQLDLQDELNWKLNLNQTTPQTIINWVPVFEVWADIVKLRVWPTLAGHEDAAFSVAWPDVWHIANFRDRDWENVFRTTGRLSEWNFSSDFWDMDWAYWWPTVSIRQNTWEIKLNAWVNKAKLNAQPTGTDDLAIATTKYVDDNAWGWTTRTDLATRRTVAPTLYDTQATYKVFEYTYWTINYYRTVYNIYTPATDIFYAEDTLETVIATRALSI